MTEKNNTEKPIKEKIVKSNNNYIIMGIWQLILFMSISYAIVVVTLLAKNAWLLAPMAPLAFLAGKMIIMSFILSNQGDK